MRALGFSLLDLLITVTIVSILLAVAVPSFSDHLHSSRLKTATNSLFEAIEFTRTKAVFSNKRTTLRKKSDWSNGWEIFIDTDNNGELSKDEVVLLEQQPLTDIRIKANTPIKNFVSYVGTGESRNANGNSGGAFQAGTFTLCPKTRGSGYKLVIARGGRARMATLSMEECDELYY